MGRQQTVRTVISKISERPVHPHAALVVIYGADLGRKHDLERSRTLIGRSPEAVIRVDEEAISRSHAELALDEHGKVALRDLRSTNGTYLNDELLARDEQRVLGNGDLVKIGRTIFKFIAGGNIEGAYHHEIYRLTTVDGLTQVYNRRYFEEQVEREVSRCHRYGRDLSLVMMDVDHFKAINDQHGHLAGDGVLKQLAAAIQSRIRREDVLARYGGEEFALLLPEVGGRGAVQMAEKVRKLVERCRFEFDGNVVPVTLSLGVATLSRERRDSLDLVRAADEKLYAAKEAGRNRVCS